MRRRLHAQSLERVVMLFELSQDSDSLDHGLLLVGRRFSRQLGGFEKTSACAVTYPEGCLCICPLD